MDDIKVGTIGISGLSDLKKRLKEFPAQLQDRVMWGAIMAGTKVIQQEAKALAPVLDNTGFIGPVIGGKIRKNPRVSGQLRESIKIKRAPKKASSMIEYWLFVTSKAWYWRFLEFGTKKMSAKSFMRRAFDTKKEEAALRIREYLAARIEKEAAKRGN